MVEISRDGALVPNPHLARLQLRVAKHWGFEHQAAHAGLKAPSDRPLHGEHLGTGVHVAAYAAVGGDAYLGAHRVQVAGDGGVSPPSRTHRLAPATTPPGSGP